MRATGWKSRGAIAGSPENVYEVAQVDGASIRQTFLHITLPNPRGSTYTITALSLLNFFKVFRDAWLVAGATSMKACTYCSTCTATGSGS